MLQVLVTLVFTPSVWKSLQLDIEFQTGSLMIMVDISIAGKVKWNGMQVRTPYGMGGWALPRVSVGTCLTPMERLTPIPPCIVYPRHHPNQHPQQFFPFAYAMKDYFIHVGDDATGSRALCNCTSW